MYKLGLPNPVTNVITGVIKTLDNSFIPFDPNNTDYQQYLAWLAEGNTPEDAE